ncbi:MAG TPA: GNAT family N-acetyltransferase [Ktedonosporobacter sp.]|nr:GNAT family N-acetyltransferase [Ktedonosporobacter sp.]
MSLTHDRQRQFEDTLAQITLPANISIRPWTEEDFPAIQRLSSAEGWPTPEQRPDEALIAWRNSWPTLVAVEGESVVGFVRSFTDGEITLYVPELLVDAHYRGRGIGRLLLDTCHYLYPHTRIDILSTEASLSFYESYGFRLIGAGVRKSYR